MNQGYLLVDTNSLVYAHKVGGTQLLDAYLDLASKEQRLLAITTVVKEEIEKARRGPEILKYIADKHIPVIPTPQTEQSLRAGAPRKSAGEHSMTEVAAREHAQGRSTRIWSDDGFFASPQELRKAPGVQPVTTADMLDRIFQKGIIPNDFAGEMRYRQTIADYRALPAIGNSPRLNTFEPPAPGLRARMAEVSAGEAAALGLKTVAAAGLAYDGATTVLQSRRLLDQGNTTGAQSEILHFAGRAGGGAAGAVAGSSLGGAVAGPWGAVGGGILGGAAGVLGGDKLLDAVDQQHIHTQRGSDGNAWRLDERAGHGWMRMSTDEGPGRGGAPMRPVYANAQLADELDYKASSTAVELALAHAPSPRNPFSQPAGPGDAHAVDATPWTRDPATRQWSRYVADQTQAAMGNPTGSTEQASRERSAQLDRAAQAVIASNIANSSQAIAQRYQDAYEQYGWKQHGPVPTAVLNAERTPPTQQRASDGHEYTQGKDGQWTTKSTVYGTNTAQGQVRDELNATRQQMPAAPARANPPLTPQQIEAAVAPQESPVSRVTPTPGGMSFAEAHKRRDEPEQISPGSLQPVGKLDASQMDRGSKLDRAHQAQEQDLMRSLGIAMAQDRERFRNEPAPGRQQPSVERTQERAQRHLLEEAPVQKQAARPAAAAEAMHPPTAHASAAAPVHANPQGAAAALAAAQARAAAAQAELAEVREQLARMAEQRGQNALERRDERDQRETTQQVAQSHDSRRYPDAAAHDKQRSTGAVVNASPLLRDFSDPSHPQNALYNTLKEGLPARTAPELLSHVTAACYKSGIKQPNDLGHVVGREGTLHIFSNSLFSRGTTVDVTQPAPSVQQTMEQVQQFDQQRAIDRAQAQAQNAAQANQPQEPMLG